MLPPNQLGQAGHTIACPEPSSAAPAQGVRQLELNQCE